MKVSAISSTPTPAAASAGRNRPSAERFRLAGRSLRLDPRTHAVRADIADIALADRLFAPHYARPLPMACGLVATAMRAAPGDAAMAVSELLPGEAFAVLDMSGGWSWGYSTHDHYVGYVASDALVPGIPAATHVVTVPLALRFAAPDIKAPLPARLPMGARVAGSVEGAFLALADSGFVHLRHLDPLDAPPADPVAIALRLVGTPYLWGGRSGLGIDCSGLVQLAFGLCGTPLPRDSDQQRGCGIDVAADALLVRGDLVFFPGHVGIMLDADRILHANAHWMAVMVEPLVDVTARIGGDAIVARRRIIA